MNMIYRLTVHYSLPSPILPISNVLFWMRFDTLVNAWAGNAEPFLQNVQYFVLAFFWWSSKPIASAYRCKNSSLPLLMVCSSYFVVTLLPYAIFSLFHALTFTRTTLMPQFLPPGPPATAGGPPQPHPISKRLQIWVKG